MGAWRQLKSGLRALMDRRAADRDVADELAHFEEAAAAENVSRGLTPDAARRAARLEIGSALAAREEVRGNGWESAVEMFADDLRQAVRRLARRPGFAAVSILTLGLGIGATVTIFSVINGVLLKPLSHAQPDRLVALWHTAPGVNIRALNMGASLYFTYRDENRVFEDVSLWTGFAPTVTGMAEPERVRALLVTHSLLPILGERPAIGRGFTESDEDPRGEGKLMLTDAYWKLRFGGDPSVLGRRIVVDGKANEIIGVLPPSFQFMDRRDSLVMPLRFRRAEVFLIQFSFNGLARLKPGVTLAEANADVARCLRMAPDKFPMNPGLSKHAFTDARLAPTLRFMKDDLIGDIRDTLWILMGAVGLVLLIACANVANLLLVRADGRQQELAIRAALGADWSRIARELMIESVLLSGMGGAVALALTYAALRLVTSSSSLPFLPRVSSIGIDPVVVGFTALLSLAAGLAFGLIPVLKYATPRILNAMQSEGRSMSQSRERHRARGALVVVQVAMAVILLIGSGLLIRTFHALRRVDPGFSRPAEVQTAQISIPEPVAKEPEQAVRMQREIVQRFAALPGVTAAAIVRSLPNDGGNQNPLYIEDRDYGDGKLPPLRQFNHISPGYVAAMGTRLAAGREMTWEETFQQAPVALISENMARELWREPAAALGKRIRATMKDEWREVIGVIADLRSDGLNRPAPPIVYWSLYQKNTEGVPVRIVRSVCYVVRTPRAGSSEFVQEARRALAGINANLPLAADRTLEEVYAQSMARSSFMLALLGTAGTMALILGFVGIYGVISYAVSQRKREIGIRIALGSSTAGVAGIFVRQGLTLSGIGAVCGLVAALGFTRAIGSMLFGVSPADPLTYAAVMGGLVLAAMLASWLPARRAAAVDPVIALRSE